VSAIDWRSRVVYPYVSPGCALFFIVHQRSQTASEAIMKGNCIPDRVGAPMMPRHPQTQVPRETS
jgi:hypothetical protein